jgi:hypothetical protein
MKDKNGTILGVGDYVKYTVSSISSVGKIKSLEDPWCIDSWTALVENIEQEYSRLQLNLPCTYLEKLSDEKAMLYKLEGK